MHLAGCLNGSALPKGSSSFSWLWSPVASSAHPSCRKHLHPSPCWGGSVNRPSQTDWNVGWDRCEKGESEWDLSCFGGTVILFLSFWGDCIASILVRSLFLYHHAPNAAESFLKLFQMPNSVVCVYWVMSGLKRDWDRQLVATSSVPRSAKSLDTCLTISYSKG